MVDTLPELTVRYERVADSAFSDIQRSHLKKFLQT